MADLVIDTRGLTCPLPVLKVRKSMRAVTAGCEVEVLATDPLAAEDVRAYCAATGNKLLQSEANTFGVWRFLIRKC